jgi:hypothetical protein
MDLMPLSLMNLKLLAPLAVERTGRRSRISRSWSGVQQSIAIFPQRHILPKNFQSKVAHPTWRNLLLRDPHSASNLTLFSLWHFHIQSKLSNLLPQLWQHPQHP